MGEKSTHLLNMFFDFLSCFLRVWLQSLKKVQIWPKFFFFEINRKRCQKTRDLTLISNPLKKLLKNAHKKVISKTSLTNVSKSEKSAYFRNVFANNSFLMHFSNLFQWIRNQRQILRFLIPILNSWKKEIFLFLLALFLNFDCKCAGNGSKNGKSFLWMCLRI